MIVSYLLNFCQLMNIRGTLEGTGGELYLNVSDIRIFATTIMVLYLKGTDLAMVMLMMSDRQESGYLLISGPI